MPAVASSYQLPVLLLPHSQLGSTSVVGPWLDTLNCLLAALHSQVEVGKSYGRIEWREDLKTCCRRAGAEVWLATRCRWHQQSKCMAPVAATRSSGCGASQTCQALASATGNVTLCL
jgi:hypothetical protein